MEFGNMKINKLVVFSGAGLSSESGVSTFRDNNGLWDNFNVEEICNQSTWLQNYHKVHEFYNSMRIKLKDVEPNDAHKRLVDWQKRWGEDRIKLITTNVDDLIERAGGNNVLHIHGDIRYIQMPNGAIRDIGYEAWDYKNDGFNGDPELAVKPGVTFFGGMDHKYPELYEELGDLTYGDAILVIGSSDQIVVPTAFLGDAIMKIRVNNDPNCNLHYDKFFDGAATKALQRMEGWLESVMD